MEQVRPLNLFIASAGLGNRLRPVTTAFPKPLLPLAGVPLIERLLHSVQASLTIQNFAMNLHYKPDLFQKWAQELPPDLLHPPKGCPFAGRCPHAMQICIEEQPPTFAISENHTSACWLLHEDAPKVGDYITAEVVSE